MSTRLDGVVVVTGAGAPAVDDMRVAIVGAGFGGLCLAIRLKQEGIDDFVVLERADDLGGTWRDNTYPGCACDVPSHLYSFSFALNPDWSHIFARQGEIREYLRECAERFGVVPHIRYGHEVQGADWDDASDRWVVQTAAGEVRARVLVAAGGPLSQPSLPKLPGVERFAGTMFHSAQWDHGHDLRGKRVAVIGTGASAIQFVPRIQSKVAQLHLFQRTPPWVLPRPEHRITGAEKLLLRRVPGLQRAIRGGIYFGGELGILGLAYDQRLVKPIERLAVRHLHAQVKDPELRLKLTPSYRLGCKRILGSSDYYPALTRPNAEVVTDPIERIRKQEIVTADGSVREIDTIIFATGFHVTDNPMTEMVRGRDGRTLADVWQGSPQAYLGMAMPGFPNGFLLVGPNTGLGNNSIVFMIEAQVRYIVGAVKEMSRHGLGAIEVRPDVNAAFQEEVQARMPGTVWTDGGCRSWYLDASGRNSTLWPDFTWRYALRTRRFELDDYRARLDLEDGLRAPGRRPVAA
ncbi:MAG: flavin-containing monooxygenase [Solirubrobacteraceae bacterium]